MSKTVADQVTDIGYRLDVLLEKIKSVLPAPILDEDKIVRLMFGESSSPLKTLTVTYLRLEPLIRFCEMELVPAVEEENTKASKKETKPAPEKQPKAVAQ